MFHPIPGGATAKPFVTHHNALDIDLYLRIAPELYLKRLVVGGFEKVFEIGAGVPQRGPRRPRHNPEFTMLELYQAYADYPDIMGLIEELVAHLATELLRHDELTYGGRELDLTPPWRRATMAELVEEQIGVHVDLRTPIDELRAHRATSTACTSKRRRTGPGKLILEIYEKTTEAELWGPVFVMDYPKEVSPLARDHREMPGLRRAVRGDRRRPRALQRVQRAHRPRRAAGAGSRRRRRRKAAGDDEAMAVDEDYLRALEYGLPPTGGLGIGIDRLVMLLADAPDDPRRHPVPDPAARAGLSGCDC